MSPDDTIVAVSSPPGRSGRGLLRISGPGVRQLAEALLQPAPTAARALTPTILRLTSDSPTARTSFSLPVLALWFAGPSSYTGQDMLELLLPGHPALVERVLGQVLAHGARRAEPGEFTFRAFLARKLDLTQAEGVAATIAAVSDSQLAAATLLRAGQLGAWAQDVSGQLADTLALIEAGIDFTDQDDVVAVTPGELSIRLGRLREAVEAMLAHSRSWRALDALPRLVLAGRPNSGKSTLFNALLGRTRVVTSPVPGTTRDIIEEPLTLTLPDGRRFEVMLVDIAGLDPTPDALNDQLQAAVEVALRRADMVLLLDDGAEDGPVVLPALRPEVGIVRLRTKADLRCGVMNARDVGIPVSAVTGQGLEVVRQALAARLSDRGVNLAGDILALQPRHESALRAALSLLTQAQALVSAQAGKRNLTDAELIAGSLRAALDELEGLAGWISPDDVLGRVFATFCIGK